MQQYFENRTLTKVEDIKKDKKKYENIILANERVDGTWVSEDYVINNSTFAKMGFLGAKFSNDDLKFNVYIDCYFKRAIFEDVNFTGSIFINCNFDEVTLMNTTFDYCKFDGCFIKYKYLIQTLSTRPNIRWEICKNMSLQCLNLGHEDEYRKYYFEEKKASEQYYWKKFWHKGTEKYYKKYNGVDQLSGIINYCISKLNKLLWGYGEKLSRLIFNMIIVIIAFAFGYYKGIPSVTKGVAMNGKIAIYMSLSNFFTVSCDYIPQGVTYKTLSVLEGGVGIILMGFFVAALFRYINRRG